MAESKAERALQDALTKAGATGWISNGKGIQGTPDIVWPHLTPPIAVFVDGCFWHGCPQHYKNPRKRGKKWLRDTNKRKRNDRGNGWRCIHCKEYTGLLPEAGWIVVRAWEHDIKENTERVAHWVIQEIKRQRRLLGFSGTLSFGRPEDSVNSE